MAGENGKSEYPPVEPLPDTEEISILTKHFIEKFDSEPQFFVAAPGRVNLIGEHIDYCGFTVCPMAVQQHILVAFKLSEDSTLKLTNVQDEKFKDFEGSINDVSISVDGLPLWHQYFLCAVKGILKLLPEESAPCGFYAAVYGNIPPRSGLSSSSALVSAATLALAHGYNLVYPKNKLAEIAAESERYIGTQGGGMDQAISFLATEGCAKHISFNPLTATDVPLPEDAVFVIANSLVEMNKAATADFNSRVVECRLSVQILGNNLRLKWFNVRKVKDLQQRLNLPIRHIKALAMETLHEKPYTKGEICREFQIKPEKLDETSLTENTKHLEEFKLKQRLLHVTREVERVSEFLRHCKECAEGKSKSKECLWSLGRLMKQSHEDLKDLYECSHEELDKIVAIANEFTYGGRLTGAGWGGCTVALADKSSAEAYIDALKEKFYAENPRAEDLDLDSLVFATQPGRGAVIYVKG